MGKSDTQKPTTATVVTSRGQASQEELDRQTFEKATAQKAEETAADAAKMAAEVQAADEAKAAAEKAAADQAQAQAQAKAEQEAAEKAAAAAQTRQLVPGVTVKNVAKSDAELKDVDLPEVKEALAVGEPASCAAIGQIIKFCDAMHPGKANTPEKRAEQQVVLHTALFTILTQETKNFNKVWRAVVAIFRRHLKTVFDLRNINEGLVDVPTSKISSAQMAGFNQLVQMIRSEARGAKPSDVLKNVDANKVIKSIANVKAQAALQRYYSAV